MDRMSIFDYFASKPADEPEKKRFPSIPFKKLFSDLDAAGEAAKARYPEDGKTVDAFVSALKEAVKSRAKRAAADSQRPLKAEAQFFLSKDRMIACACLLPPENGGGEITLEEFLEDMRYEGIVSGILQEEIPQEFAGGYLRIFPAARGTLPQAGEDGKVEELFPRNGEMCLEASSQGQVDFHQDLQLQPIRKGEIICRIQPPRAGTDGTDVTGQRLPCPQVGNAQVPQGEHTVIDGDGLSLTADTDGILYFKDGQFCIHAQEIVAGDLDRFQGTLRILGNLYVEGNVDGGVEVEASGDIMIHGKLGQARVTSIGGTIRVQQGIYGTEGKTFLKAGRQIQAPVMEWAEINAGTDVIGEMISNCTIRCGGTAFAVAGRGMIAGSLIQAGGSILCLRIGNLAGDRSRFSVGYPLDAPESWNRLRTELAEVQATVKKLWTTVADLRKKGTQLSEKEKSVLDQLVKQRDLYSEKRDALTAELAALDKVLDKESRGRIQCEKLQSFLDVQIGRLTKEITTPEENCNIHADKSRIFLR